MCKFVAPPVWLIDKLEVLQKFIPVLYDDKVFYKSIDTVSIFSCYGNINENNLFITSNLRLILLLK